MPTRDNEWSRELRLNNAQVTTLFDSLCFDETFSRQWFSTSALTEIINIQYQLAENHKVLEADQFNETLCRNKSRVAIFTENLKECSPGMVCRTMIHSYHHGSNEYAYCFPTPEKRKRRWTEQDKVIGSRRSTRTNKSHDVNINDRTLPGIPCPDVMQCPNILEILKKRKTSISVLDVIGNVQQAECNTPKRKKKVQATTANLVSPEKDESKIDESESSSANSVLSLNLGLVDIWKSKTPIMYCIISRNKVIPKKSFQLVWQRWKRLISDSLKQKLRIQVLAQRNWIKSKGICWNLFQLLSWNCIQVANLKEGKGRIWVKSCDPNKTVDVQWP